MRSASGRRLMNHRLSLLCVLILVGTITSVSAQSRTVDQSPDPHVLELAPFPDSGPKQLTVDDVIRMSKAKVSDDVIIEQLKQQGQRFNLTNDQLLQLKTAHVSKRVIQAMLDPYPSRNPAPSSSGKSAVSKATASSTNTASASPFVQCLRSCNQTYEQCRARAQAKMPEVCVSRDDRCDQLLKQWQAEEHACFLDVGKCDAGCQKL